MSPLERILARTLAVLERRLREILKDEQFPASEKQQLIVSWKCLNSITSRFLQSALSVSDEKLRWQLIDNYFGGLEFSHAIGSDVESAIERHRRSRGGKERARLDRNDVEAWHQQVDVFCLGKRLTDPNISAERLATDFIKTNGMIRGIRTIADYIRRRDDFLQSASRLPDSASKPPH